MSEPFIGEIRMFGGNFAPRGWQFCQGQLLSIAQNSALFSLLGTTYGGNGQTTFGLPDLRARVPVGIGNNPPGGLQAVQQGEMAGVQNATLTSNNMPQHTHTAAFTGTGGGTPTPPTLTIAVASAAATVSDPNGAVLAIQQAGRTQTPMYAPVASATPNASLGGVSITPGSSGAFTGGTVAVGAAGGSQPFSILNPYIGINFIIAIEGIFPSRN